MTKIRLGKEAPGLLHPGPTYFLLRDETGDRLVSVLGGIERAEAPAKTVERMIAVNRATALAANEAAAAGDLLPEQTRRARADLINAIRAEFGLDDEEETNG